MMPLWKVDLMIFVFLVFVVLMLAFRNKSGAWDVLSILVIFPCFLAVEGIRTAAKERGLDGVEMLAMSFLPVVFLMIFGVMMEEKRLESGKSVWFVWKWVAGGFALSWALGLGLLALDAVIGLAAGSFIVAWGKPAILALLSLLGIAMAAVRFLGF